MSRQSYPATWTEEPTAEQDKHQILIADDDPSLVRLLEEILQYEGYAVTGAYDGQMALRLAHQNAYDLIILDVNMPMLSGIKVLEYLRTFAATATIPVIFVTGELSKDVFPLISKAPRVAHVKKPLDLESFSSLVRQFIKQYPRS